MSSSFISDGAHNSQLHNILQVLESWHSWDDVTALAHHEKVREYLLTCLESTNQLHDLQSDALEVSPVMDLPVRATNNLLAGRRKALGRSYAKFSH